MYVALGASPDDNILGELVGLKGYRVAGRSVTQLFSFNLFATILVQPQYIPIPFGIVAHRNGDLAIKLSQLLPLHDGSALVLRIGGYRQIEYRRRLFFYGSARQIVIHDRLLVRFQLLKADLFEFNAGILSSRLRDGCVGGEKGHQRVAFSAAHDIQATLAEQVTGAADVFEATRCPERASPSTFCYRAVCAKPYTCFCVLWIINDDRPYRTIDCNIRVKFRPKVIRYPEMIDRAIQGNTASGLHSDYANTVSCIISIKHQVSVTNLHFRIVGIDDVIRAEIGVFRTNNIRINRCWVHTGTIISGAKRYSYSAIRKIISRAVLVYGRVRHSVQLLLILFSKVELSIQNNRASLRNRFLDMMARHSFILDISDTRYIKRLCAVYGARFDTSVYG